MSRKIDFHDDPEAPRAQHIVPAVSVVVTNDADEILLIRRTDNDNWALPGGAVDIGESLPQAAIRETREETGVDCEITGLSGIYTDPGHVILYTSNGEVRQEFSIVLTARATGGQPTPSSESSEVRWIDAGRDRQLPDGHLNAASRPPLHPSTAISPTSAKRRRLRHSRIQECSHRERSSQPARDATDRRGEFRLPSALSSG